MCINKEGFGKRLEELIKQKGYTNTKLTKELNISKNVIGNMINNQIPRAELLYNIALKLDTSVEYLLTGKYNFDNTGLIYQFNELNEENQKTIIKQIEWFLHNQKEKEINQEGKSSTSKIG